PASLHLVGGGVELDRVIGAELLEGPGNLLDPPLQAVEVARAGPSRVPAHLEEPNCSRGDCPPPLHPSSDLPDKRERSSWSVDMHNLTERGHPPASSKPAPDQRRLLDHATDAILTIGTDGTLG